MSDADIGCCGRLVSSCKTKTPQECDNRTCKKIQYNDDPDEPYKQEEELTFDGPDPNKKTVMKVTVLSFNSPTQNRNVVDVKMRDSKGELVSPQKVAIAQGKRDAAARGCESAPLGQGRGNSGRPGRPGRPTGCCSNCSRLKGGDGHGGPGCSKVTRGKHSSECGCAARGSPTRVTQSKNKAGGKQAGPKGPKCHCVRRDSGGGSVRCGCKVAACPAQKDPRRSAIKAAVAARADGVEAAECGCARGQAVPPCECMKSDCPAKKSRDKETIRAAVAARSDGFPASECGCPDPPEAPVPSHKSVKAATPPPPPPPVEPDIPAHEKREKDVEDAVLYEKVTAYQTGDAFSLKMAESEGSLMKMSEGEGDDEEDENLPFSNVYTVTYRVRTKAESLPFSPDSAAVGSTKPGACPCSITKPHEAIVSRCSCGKKYLRPQCGAQLAQCSCGNQYLKHDKATTCSCQRKRQESGGNPCAGVQPQPGQQEGGGSPGAANDGTYKGNACEIARLARLRAAKEEKRRRREARRAEGGKKPEVEIDTTARPIDTMQPEPKPGESATNTDIRPRAASLTNELVVPPQTVLTPTKSSPPPPPQHHKGNHSKKDSKKDGHKHKHRDKRSNSAHFAQLEVPTTLPNVSSECVTGLTNLDSLENFIGEQKVSAYSMSLVPAVAPRHDSVIDVAMAEAQLKLITDSLRQEVTASLKDQAALVADLSGKFSELTGQVERQTNDIRTMLGDCLAQIAVRSSRRDLRTANTGSYESTQSCESDSEHSMTPRRRGSRPDLHSSESDNRSRSMSDLSFTESEASLDLRQRDRPRPSIIRGSSMSSIGSQRSYSSAGTDASAVSSGTSVATADDGNSDNSYDSAQGPKGGRRRFGFLRR